MPAQINNKLLILLCIWLWPVTAQNTAYPPFSREFTFQSCPQFWPEECRCLALTESHRIISDDLTNWLSGLSIIREKGFESKSLRGLAGGIALCAVQTSWDPTLLRLKVFLTLDSARAMALHDSILIDRHIMSSWMQTTAQRDSLLKQFAWCRILADSSDKEVCRTGISSGKKLLVQMTALLAYETALQYSTRGEYAASQRTIDSTLNIMQNETRLYTLRGRNDLALGNHPQAIRDCSKSLNLDPLDTWARSLRVEAFLALKKFDRAIADCDALLRISTNDPDTWYMRGLTNAQTNHLSEAIEDFSHALAQKPDYVQALVMRGNTNLMARQIALAIADCDRAISLDSTDSRSFIIRADAYRKNGMLPQAIADYSAAIARNPASARTFLKRGEILCDAGEYWRAVSDCSRAIELDPNLGAAYLCRARLYDRLGKPDAAINDRIIAARQGNDEARELLRKTGKSW